MESLPNSNPIKKRTEQVSEKLGVDITQVGKSQEELSSMSVRELRNKYPERYDIYQEIFTAIRHGKDVDAEALDKKREWVQALNNLGEYIQRHHEGDATLRGKQATVFEDLHDFLEEGGTEGYVVLPTGVGKTVLFTEFIEALDVRSMIVVPTQTLVRQTGEKIKQFAPEMEYGSVYAKEKDFGRQATVITYDSFVIGVRNGTINPDDYKALILDEVHESLSPARREAVNTFSDSIKIGFTATPEYSNAKSTENLLKNEIHRLEIREAVEEGLLAPLTCILVRTKADMSTVERKPSGEYDDTEFEAQLRAYSINKACVELYKKAYKGKQAIVFANSIAHSRELEKEFADRNIFAACLDGDVEEDEQIEIIKAYEEGTIEVIIGVDMLTRGFDAPQASVCLNLAPTTSKVRATQRGGRVLRLDEDNPEKEAHIVDFIYEDDRGGKASVLFSTVVGEASVVPSNYSSTRYPGGVGGSGRGSYIPNTSIEGLEIITDVDEVMRISREIEEKEIDFAPDGWLNTADFTRKFSCDARTVQRIAEPYFDDAEYVRIFKPKSGPATQYYSPELVEIITNELTKLDKAPENWMTISAIASRFGVGHKTVKKLVEPYKDNEQYAGVFKTKTGSTDFYSPELIERLASQLNSAEEPPQGWITHNSVMKSLGMGSVTLEKIVEKYEQNSDYVGTYKARLAPTKYYSPELVRIITETYNSAEKPPEGWMSLAVLAKQMEVSPDTLKPLAERYAEDKDYIGTFKPSTGSSTQYYSPKFAELARQELRDVPPPPDGWTSSGIVEKEVSALARRIAESYKENSQYVGIFIGKNGRKAEYYSPEMVEIIKARLIEMSTIPEGWVDTKSVAEQLGLGTSMVDNLTKPYNEDEQYTQRILSAKGVAKRYYSPELVKLLKESRK